MHPMPTLGAMIAAVQATILFVDLAGYTALTEAHGDAHHDEAPKKEAGPNGGRIIDSVTPPIEFWVTEDRHIQLTRLNERNQAMPIGQEVISLVGGDIG